MVNDSPNNKSAQSADSMSAMALLRMGAYVAAGFTGIRLGITKIWDMAYDNFKDYKQFDELRTQRRADLANIPVIGKIHNWDRKKIASEIRQIERDYGHDFNDILKRDFKIESEGPIGFLKGTVQRFETLGGYTRAKIAFAGVLSTVAAVGGLVLIERYATGHPMRKLHDDVQAHANASERSA
jgi:hypothetical protein